MWEEEKEEEEEEKEPNGQTVCQKQLATTTIMSRPEGLLLAASTAARVLAVIAVGHYWMVLSLYGRPSSLRHHASSYDRDACVVGW